MELVGWRPKLVTPIVREETEDGWRVVRGTFPPVLLGEGLSEAEAIGLQDAELDVIQRTNEEIVEVSNPEGRAST